MIPEKATRLLMELSVYNEVEEELLKQNKLRLIKEDYTASIVVMHMSWSSTAKGGLYWSRIHDQLERMERAEERGDVLPVF